MNFHYLTLDMMRVKARTGYMVRILDPHGHQSGNSIKHLCYIEQDPQPRIETVFKDPINGEMHFYQELPE